MVQNLMRMIASLLLAVLLTAGSLQANELEEAVIVRLANAANQAERSGYGMSHAPYVDKLSGGKDELSLTLQRGIEYTIIGVCDNQCGDVDIRLYDEANNLIDEDVTDNRSPSVRVNPQWTGKFTIQVEMYRCKKTPCYYAVGVLAR